jgi:DNA-binding transcriptional ArsR family regulator
MPVAIDIRGLGPADFRLALSPLAELGTVLHVLAEPGHHGEQRELITDLAGDIPGELTRTIRQSDYLWRTSRCDMFLPADPAPDLSGELDALDRLDDEEWVASALLTSSCGSIPLLRDAGSPLSDPATRRIALERASARGERQARYVGDLLSDPGAARRRTRTLLEDCGALFFDELWTKIKPHLATDVRHKRDLFQGPGPRSALPALSSSLTLSGDGSRLLVDKVESASTSAAGTGTTILPTVFGDPHLLVVHAPGRKPVIQYPATITTQITPNNREIQARLKALDNPVRFRLAKSLARAPRTTAELADLWGLTPPEVSRHLAILKAAGLTTTKRQGRYVTYALDLKVLSRLGKDAAAAFLR